MRLSIKISCRAYSSLKSLHVKSKSQASFMVLKIVMDGYSMSQRRRADTTISSKSSEGKCNGLVFQSGSGLEAMFTGLMGKLALENQR